MAGRIKGITIEFNGETTKLNKALSKVSTSSKKINSELKEIESSLNFDPRNVDLLAQKQRVLKESISNTSEKLKILKNGFEEAGKALANGDIDQSAFDELQREILKTERILGSYENRLKESAAEEENFAKTTKRLETFFRATETTIDDFSNVIGIKLYNSYKNGTTSAKEQERILNKLSDAYLGVKGSTDKFKNKLDRIDGQPIKKATKALQDFKDKAFNANTTIDDTQTSLLELANTGELRSAFSDLFNSIKDGANQIKDAIQDALEYDSEQTKIEVNLELNEEDTKIAKQTLNHVKALGIDGSEALKGLSTQMKLNKNATLEQNKAIVEGAAAISSAYDDIGFDELITQTNKVSGSLKISNKDALALINSLLKAGFPPSEIDVISEYGLQLKNAGYNAEEIRGIMASGIDTKTWNVDNLLDGLKEGRIKMIEFGNEVPKALGMLLDKAKISKSEFQQLGKEIAAGGEKGKKAYAKVASLVQGVTDKTVQGELGVQIYGTKWEDQGTNITKTIQGMTNNLKNMNDMHKDVNSATSKMNNQPAVQMKEAMLQLKEALAPVMEKLAGLVSHVANFAKQHPYVVAFIGALITMLGILVPIILSIVGVYTALSVAAAAANIALLPTIGIIAGIIAAITAVIAIGYLLYENWDYVWNGIKQVTMNIWEAISSFCSEFWEALKNSFNAFLDAIKNVVLFYFETYKMIITTAITIIKTVITTVFNAIKFIITSIWQGIKFVISSAINGIRIVITTVMNVIKTTITTVWNGIKTATSNVWNVIKQVISLVWQGIKLVVTTYINTVKSIVTFAWNAIKGVTSSVWNGIKTVISGVLSGIRNTVSNVFNGVKNTTSSIFNGIRSTAVSVWDGIKNAITSPIEYARDKVRSAIDSIKGFFSGLSLELPHIKVPHFSISGGFSINPPRIPRIGIEWYKKGGILKRPTAFGMNGSNLMVGGEAGAEAVAPISTLTGYVEQAVKNQTGDMSNKLDTLNLIAEKMLQVISTKESKLILKDEVVGNIMNNVLEVTRKESEVY